MQNFEDHYAFILRTDRKSLYTQIKAIVTKAQDVANEELQQRSRRLQQLLEREDKIYENEFAKKVKTRIDEDIRDRKDVLVKIKEESTKKQKAFLESKRIQQVMESCYEIREALRQQDLRNVKICQQEQMIEKQRQQRRDCELEHFWMQVQQKNIEEYDKKRAEEDYLRKQLNAEMRCILKIQLEEDEMKREEQRKLKEEDKNNLNKLLEEIRLEEFDKTHRPNKSKQEKYRQELLDEIEAKKAARIAEKRAQCEEHFAFIQETQRLEAKAKKAAAERKRALHQATIEYISYVRRMRQLETGIQKMMHNRTDDLYHVDTCTKSSIMRETRRRAEAAAKCHAELKRQICEQVERRLREEAEFHECKIIENRFVHPEVSREEIIKKRRQMRLDLDKQIEVMKRVREEEEQKFEHRLLKAIDDPEVCDQLAEEYIRDGVDYLEPHPNWRILASPEKIYVPKGTLSAELGTDDVPQEGAATMQSRGHDNCSCPNSRKPCCNVVRPAHATGFRQTAKK